MLLTLLSNQQVSTGALYPARLDNTNAVYNPTVARGTIALAPGLLTNSSSFYSATITTSGGGSVRDWRLLLRIRRLQPYKRRYRV